MPNLAAILKDPNYVNANAETKKAIFDKYSVQDTNYTSANAETQAAIRQRFGVETQQTTQAQPYQRQPSLGEKIRGVAYPVAEAVGAGLGGLVGTGVGPAGTVAGASLGYAGVKGLENLIDQYTGAAQPETLGQAAARTAKDVATGATYEMGGQILGKVAAPVVGKVVEKVTGKGPVKASTVEELKQVEDQAWDKVKNSTTTFKDPVPLKDNVEKLLSDKGFNYKPSTFPSLNEPLKELNAIYDSALKGAPASIHDMRTVRTLLQDLRMSGGAKPREKELAGKIMDSLDDYVTQYGGKDAAAWKEARDVSNQIYRSRDVQGIAKAAEESSRTTSSEIRDQFKDLLNSNKLRMYSPEQQAVIKQIAEGSATEKTFELIGKMAPKNPTWNALLAMVNAPVLLGSMAARGTANALAKSRVNMLDELIRGGQIPKTIQLPQTAQRLMPAGVNALLSTRSSP